MLWPLDATNIPPGQTPARRRGAQNERYGQYLLVFSRRDSVLSESNDDVAVDGLTDSLADLLVVPLQVLKKCLVVLEVISCLPKQKWTGRTSESFVHMIASITYYVAKVCVRDLLV